MTKAKSHPMNRVKQISALDIPSSPSSSSSAAIAGGDSKQTAEQEWYASLRSVISANSSASANSPGGEVVYEPIQLDLVRHVDIPSLPAAASSLSEQKLESQSQDQGQGQDVPAPPPVPDLNLIPVDAPQSPPPAAAGNKRKSASPPTEGGEKGQGESNKKVKVVDESARETFVQELVPVIDKSGRMQSPYNSYMKSFLAQLKFELGDIPHRHRFNSCAKLWKTQVTFTASQLPAKTKMADVQQITWQTVATNRVQVMDALRHKVMQEVSAESFRGGPDRTMPLYNQHVHDTRKIIKDLHPEWTHTEQLREVGKQWAIIKNKLKDLGLYKNKSESAKKAAQELVSSMSRPDVVKAALDTPAESSAEGTDQTALGKDGKVIPRKPAKLSVYNDFMKAELARLKSLDSSVPYNDRFGQASKHWNENKEQIINEFYATKRAASAAIVQNAAVALSMDVDANIPPVDVEALRRAAEAVIGTATEKNVPTTAEAAGATSGDEAFYLAHESFMNTPEENAELMKAIAMFNQEDSEQKESALREEQKIQEENAQVQQQLATDDQDEGSQVRLEEEPSMPKPASRKKNSSKMSLDEVAQKSSS